MFVPGCTERIVCAKVAGTLGFRVSVMASVRVRVSRRSGRGLPADALSLIRLNQ